MYFNKGQCWKELCIKLHQKHYKHHGKLTESILSLSNTYNLFLIQGFVNKQREHEPKTQRQPKPLLQRGTLVNLKTVKSKPSTAAYLHSQLRTRTSSFLRVGRNRAIPQADAVLPGYATRAAAQPETGEEHSPLLPGNCHPTAILKNRGWSSDPAGDTSPKQSTAATAKRISVT